MALVSLTTVKQLGRIDTNAHDSLLNTLIESAQNYAFNYCECVEATGANVVLEVSGGCFLWIPKAPVYEVVEVYDLLNKKIIDPDEYSNDESKIWLIGGTSFTEGYKNMRVTVKAGYNTNPTTPIANAPVAPPLMGVVIAELALRYYNNTEGAKRMSGAGTSVEWQALEESDDIHANLRRLSLGRFIS